MRGLLWLLRGVGCAGGAAAWETAWWIVVRVGQVLGMVVVVVMGCVFGSFWIGLRVEVWIAQAVLTG